MNKHEEKTEQEAHLSTVESALADIQHEIEVLCRDASSDASHISALLAEYQELKGEYYGLE